MNNKLWLTLFLLSWIPTLFMVGRTLYNSTTCISYNYNCRNFLLNLESALEMYCDDHNAGRLPEASGLDDYFYWTKGITKEYLREINLYCPWDEAKKDPSSYISDPRLAGRKISDLKKIPHLVILREREYRHPGHRAAFCGSDINGMYSQDQLPKDVKYNLELPERENREVPDIEKIHREREALRIIETIGFFLFPFLTVTLYILWAYSRHLNRKSENTERNPT